MVITSKDNETIKKIRKLKEKKYRDIDKKYIIEGVKLIKEAIEEKAEIDTIVVCENCVQTGEIDSKTLYEIAKYNCVYVDVTDVQNPQGLLAVVDKNCKEQQIKYDEDAIVILDGIQDPGNLGTILRTIDSVRIITSCSI